MMYLQTVHHLRVISAQLGDQSAETERGIFSSMRFCVVWFVICIVDFIPSQSIIRRSACGNISVN